MSAARNILYEILNLEISWDLKISKDFKCFYGLHNFLRFFKILSEILHFELENYINFWVIVFCWVVFVINCDIVSVIVPCVEQLKESLPMNFITSSQAWLQDDQVRRKDLDSENFSCVFDLLLGKLLSDQAWWID